MRSKLAAIVMFGAPLCCAACAGSSMPTGSSPAQLSASPPGEARVGDAARCPVSGETFVVNASSPKVEYEGKTYYFCCADCTARFQADPHQFLSRQGSAARATY